MGSEPKGEWTGPSAPKANRLLLDAIPYIIEELEEEGDKREAETVADDDEDDPNRLLLSRILAF